MKPTHIILVYKPPETKLKSFIEHLTINLEISNPDECLVIGDMNIDLLKHSNSKRDFLQTMNDSNFTQLIRQPTRIVQKQPASLLDCIFTNKPELNLLSGVSSAKLSDHHLVYTIRKKQRT